MTPFQTLTSWRRSLENNNNTYKFVLALSILKRVDKNKYTISYRDIAYDFIEFYWNQALIYKVKHAVSEKQEPLVIQKIRNKAPEELKMISFANPIRFIIPSLFHDVI